MNKTHDYTKRVILNETKKKSIYNIKHNISTLEYRKNKVHRMIYKNEFI